MQGNLLRREEGQCIIGADEFYRRIGNAQITQRACAEIIRLIDIVFRQTEGVDDGLRVLRIARFPFRTHVNIQHCANRRIGVCPRRNHRIARAASNQLAVDDTDDVFVGARKRNAVRPHRVGSYSHTDLIHFIGIERKSIDGIPRRIEEPLYWMLSEFGILQKIEPQPR